MYISIKYIKDIIKIYMHYRYNIDIIYTCGEVQGGRPTSGGQTSGLDPVSSGRWSSPLLSVPLLSSPLLSTPLLSSPLLSSLTHVEYNFVGRHSPNVAK